MLKSGKTKPLLQRSSSRLAKSESIFKKTKFEVDLLKGRIKLMHSRNINKWRFDFHPQVSIISTQLVILFIAATLINPTEVNELLTGGKGSITDNWNLFFIMSANILLIFPVYLMFSKLGEIKTGGPKAKPDYTNFAWYSMLISAGMGIGLMFWSVGELLYHATGNLPMTTGHSVGAALGLSFFHWALHPWGIYALFSLLLAFYPILRDRVFGWIGGLVDITVVISSLFVLATSLGFGAQQMNSGLHFLMRVPVGSIVKTVILCGLPFTFMLLAMVYSLYKGLKADFYKLKAYGEYHFLNKIFNEKIVSKFETDAKIKERLHRD